MAWHGAGVADLSNLEALKALLRPFFAAFPDIQMTIEDLVAESDRVVARYTWRGTQRGPFQGLPPTGRSVAVAGTGIFRLMDGRIAEEWWQEDLLGLMAQLGALPVPAY
jgi:steroid delta-isomerase-like uncharacterized protein